MPHRMHVRDIMATDLVTLMEDETLADAQRCMDRGRLRHLPVVWDGKLVGLVTHRDLLAASFSLFAEVGADEQRRVFARITAKELMHSELVTVSPDCPVPRAAELLLENKFGCLPVVEKSGRLVGIVTEADFLELTVRLLS